MNRRELETLLLTLESTPALLARAAEGITPSQAIRRPARGGFSLVENVWHLADLEREGYGERIRRLLAEEEPALPDFDGERLARERRYQDRDLTEGLHAFAAARRRNVERLEAASPEDWKRHGLQESVGRVLLADMPRMMAGHDRSHTEDVRALLAEIRPGLPSPEPRPTSAVA